MVSDDLTPHERDAIAAFKGEVQRIPAGQASELAEAMAVGMHWRDRHEIARRMFARSQRFAALKRRETAGEKPPPVARPEPVLVMVTPPRAVAPKPRLKPKRAPRPPKPSKVKAAPKAPRKPVGGMSNAERMMQADQRREQVAVMVRDGMPTSAIATAMGVTTGTIIGYVADLRARGVLPRPDGVKAPAERVADVGARREMVRQMIAGGASRFAAAADLGVSWSTIGNDIDALRAAGKLPPARPSGRWK